MVVIITFVHKNKLYEAVSQNSHALQRAREAASYPKVYPRVLQDLQFLSIAKVSSRTSTGWNCTVEALMRLARMYLPYELLHHEDLQSFSELHYASDCDLTNFFQFVVDLNRLLRQTVETIAITREDSSMNIFIKILEHNFQRSSR